MRYNNLILLTVIVTMFMTSCSSEQEIKSEESISIKQDTPVVTNIKNEKKDIMEHLTVETFKEKVFNYEENKEWKFEGELPAIIDFYADWCGPCKMVAPILEELQAEYEGKIKIYKVNTEEQQALSAVFGIRSIPSILFIPKEGQPQMSAGALPKDGFKKAINEILLVPQPVSPYGKHPYN